MPSVQFMKILSDLTVASHQETMPPQVKWKAPQESGSDARDNYVDGVGQSMWGVSTMADGVLSYFRTVDPHFYHVASSADITLAYKSYVHTMLDAAAYAFNLWKPQLYFTGLKINGPVAVGSKGCLKQPSKDSYFKLFKSYPGHSAIAGGKHFNKWRDAVGKGIRDCLTKYIDGVTVPGLPWYPAFAAFPGPLAPPMPNVTWPLISLPSSGLMDITMANKIKKAILKNFDSKLKQKLKDDSDSIHETLFEAIAVSLSLGFTIWVSSQTVNMVMGTGNIPSFAPPVTPVGPVVNGQNIPTPGHLMP